MPKRRIHREKRPIDFDQDFPKRIDQDSRSQAHDVLARMIIETKEMKEDFERLTRASDG